MTELSNSREIAILGYPDPAQGLLRVFESKRMGIKMQVALAFYIEGVPLRECAKLAGLNHHTNVWRAAKRFDLQEIHKDRRLYREIARKTVNAQKFMQSGSKSWRGLIKTSSDSVDAYLDVMAWKRS